MKRLLLAPVALLLVVLAAACGGDGGDGGGDYMAAEAAVIIPAAAEAMGGVESVRFELDRGGAPVFIDDAEFLALDRVVGRVAVPGKADALIDVTISGSLATELGAIAIDGDTWLSNPITGEFEPLPAGYDLDPTMFFDPKGGWQPLIEGLGDVEILGLEDNDGERYHIRGTAPAENIEVVTARLVRRQDVSIDLWVHPVSGLVTAAGFDTELDGEITSWALRLSEYGVEFDISPPDVNG